MEKKTLTELCSKNLFQIPDYQRGYAWEEKQWSDFVQDLDALVNEEVSHHYTGTVVIYRDKKKPAINYGTTDKLETVDVVDGQQRLTTACLYLSIIIRKLINKGEHDYEQKKPIFLYASATCKLTLNSDSNNIYYDLLRTGHPNTEAGSIHEKRLLSAYRYLEGHIRKKVAEKPEREVEYLHGLYDAITRKMVFTFYAIEEECEIGMTFELMNSRGKGLSVLELLKNYLMHWVSRNGSDETDRSVLTDIINKAWKDTYANLGNCNGSEDQCLRIAWTLQCSHTPRNWAGYQGFKDDPYMPLRNFSVKTKEATRGFIIKFAEELGKLSRHYACILCPTDENTLSAEEKNWLTKIHHTGNIANFLPLMVAARMHYENGSISSEPYLEMLKALECYAYRVFLTEGKRSNAGQSSFYSWGHDVSGQPQSIQNIAGKIHGLINYYSGEEPFKEKIRKPGNWYLRRHLLKYTLFEYELYLLSTEGKEKKPRLAWEELSDSTIEHILPQNPEEDSYWKKQWDSEMTGIYLHDIGNLVLTQDNSSYKNFDFARKKGQPGISPSYSNSAIRQERKISSFNDWRPEDLERRRQELSAWILDRWAALPSALPAISDISDEDEIDDNGMDTQVGAVMEDIPLKLEENEIPGESHDPAFHRASLKEWLEEINKRDPSIGANINKFISELLKIFSDNPPYSWRFKINKYKHPIFRLHDRTTGRDNDFLVVGNRKIIVIHKFFKERFRSLFPVLNDYYGKGDGSDLDVYCFGEEKQIEYLEAIKAMATGHPEWYIRTLSPSG